MWVDTGNVAPDESPPILVPVQIIKFEPGPLGEGHPLQGHPLQGHPLQGHPLQGHPLQSHPFKVTLFNQTLDLPLTPQSTVVQVKQIVRPQHSEITLWEKSCSHDNPPPSRIRLLIDGTQSDHNGDKIKLIASMMLISSHFSFYGLNKGVLQIYNL